MGIQKKSPIPSRLSGNAKTTTVTANKVKTVTLFDINGLGTASDSLNLDEIIAENQRRAEEQRRLEQERLEQERIAEEQRKLEEEQAIADNVAKEQEERKNSITFFKTPSNEDFEKLMNCYKNLPHKLKNIDVRNMRSSFELDLDDEDFEDIDLDADFEGVAIEAKRDGTVQHFLSLPMQEEFVNAINANTEKLKDKYNTLKSHYIGTDEDGKEITIKPFDKEYETEYNGIVAEEYDFLFGENSIIKLFEDSKQEVIEKLIDNAPDETKSDYKKLNKNLIIEVKPVIGSDIKVLTSQTTIEDNNGIYKLNKNTKKLYTKFNITLKYRPKRGKDHKKIASVDVDLLKL